MRQVFVAPQSPALADDLDGDAGMFGPDSVTWRVHADLSMLVGGIRALIVQTVHPLAIAGVAQHSQYRTDPWAACAEQQPSWRRPPTARAATRTRYRQGPLHP